MNDKTKDQDVVTEGQIKPNPQYPVDHTSNAPTSGDVTTPPEQGLSESAKKLFPGFDKFFNGNKVSDDSMALAQQVIAEDKPARLNWPMHLNAPPRPGSEAEAEFNRRWDEEQEAQIGIDKNTDVSDLRDWLQVALNQTPTDSPDAGDRARVLMKAMAAAKQVEKNHRRKRIKFWLGWFVFFALIAGIVAGGWYYGKDKLQTGRYTVPVTCKIPFGDGEFEARRHFTYPFQSLFGYHLVDEGAVTIQDEIVLKGEKLSILGIKDGRTWRKNYAKGEFGVAKLKPSDTYWFVGDNIKDTAAVRFNTFCNK